MKITKSLLASSIFIATSSLAAFDDTGTDYSNATQRSHVWIEALEPIELVNSILCFTAQFKATDFANQGPYLVLADEAACFDNEDDGSTGQSSGAANTPSYLKAVANVTRESDSAPLVISVWIPEMSGGDSDQAIKFKAEVTSGASESNPFGAFTFNFEMFDQLEGTQNGAGEIVASDSVANSIGFTLYETSNRGADTYVQSASVVMSADRSSGNAITSADRGSNSGNAYALAFNANNVLIQSANDVASLPFKTGSNSGQCLDRTQFTDSVHRYDLYNASTGAAVSLNSGFSFRYDSDSDNQVDAYGHVGYWGVWTEGDSSLANGTTLVREDQGSTENYTLVTAPGRLIKNEVKTLALSNVRGVSFSYWDSNVYSSGYNQWVVKYLTVNDDSVGTDGFYITAGLNWGDSGQQITDVTDQLISLNAGESLYMWSEQLGGEVKYLYGSSSLTYYEQTFLNGSETGTGELLENGSVTLKCFDRCPIGTFDLTDLANFEGSGSPFSTRASNVASAIDFSFSNSGSNALTLVRDSNSEPVRYNSSITKQQLNSSPHSWGVRSGPMVTSTVASSMTNVWDIYDPSVVTTYYVWETGISSWNQLSAVRNSQNNIVTFDKPIQFSYSHSNANDRSGNAGNYDGQTFLLNYGGNGDLWGIPYEKQGNQYRPKFSIADGTLMGSSNQYVIKAKEIEQQMQNATGQCTALTLQDPAVAVPTSITGNANIGVMPTVTGEPSVIAGEIVSNN
ncbi:conserved hypothetical protein [Vibrio nigripulchritudo SFn27]|uniref:Uncharacterized protein n=1 Tax=Vibrio nigripulchritudo TaxID=28173 RepID=U4KAH9_9VIBR|nr:hypothetical protein [Vibrio nigripulchritudo]CCN83680.1 conserved hypothetical protein [Vibrio nigripulchritudo BLFn1]CCN87315.1 conserved hypothetical protein [Vibrio nigripulchritudo SFn27]CCN94694.1 conserved hypothetical protein [Vibrio nigripulchritudo ENn2]CCO40765.1 conserved hypothetical protein [Vibrio nigripulchritudo SFn135]CCO54842.1 conserved hypothetical protein [Vibrio nigripulchritudo Wn13]